MSTDRTRYFDFGCRRPVQSEHYWRKVSDAPRKVVVSETCGSYSSPQTQHCKFFVPASFASLPLSTNSLAVIVSKHAGVRAPHERRASERWHPFLYEYSWKDPTTPQGRALRVGLGTQSSPLSSFVAILVFLPWGVGGRKIRSHPNEILCLVFPWAVPGYAGAPISGPSSHLSRVPTAPPPDSVPVDSTLPWLQPTREWSPVSHPLPPRGRQAPRTVFVVLPRPRSGHPRRRVQGPPPANPRGGRDGEWGSERGTEILRVLGRVPLLVIREGPT